MNALSRLRPLKPILGSGNGEEMGDFTPFPQAPRFADLFPWSAPVFETWPAPLDVAAGPDAPRPGERPAGLEPPPAEPVPPADPVAPAAIPAPALAVAAPRERILVESLGSGAIRVTGTSQGDRLSGSPGDDRLDGLAGDDIFLGSPGRDLFHGGPGHDTIRYNLLRAEVSLDTRFQRISLEDGEDQYDSIEVIDLRDGDWILTAGDPAALVHRLWLAATGQAPSAIEMIRETAVLVAGGTAESLAGRLAANGGDAAQLRLLAALGAPREGRLEQPVWLPDPEAILLARMCELTLGARPDRDVFLHWLDELEAGASPASVAAEMLSTPEVRVQPLHADGQALAAAASTWML